MHNAQHTINGGATGAEIGLPENTTPRQYLIFRLGSEKFAIDILHIREIIEFSALTTVPMMPAFLRGIINLRGAVVPVIDMLGRFGHGLTTVTRHTCIVIVEINAGGDESSVVGVMVDAVTEVADLCDIDPPPAFGSHIRADFISGLARQGQQFIIMLQLDRLLSLDDISPLNAAPALASDVTPALALSESLPDLQS